MDPLASISSRACKGHDGYESVGVAVAGFRSRAYAGYYTIEMAARKVYVVGVGMTKVRFVGHTRMPNLRACVLVVRKTRQQGRL